MRPELPHDLEAERNVLGAVLADRRAITDLGALTARDFYHPGHSACFDAIASLSAANAQIDTIAVWAQMWQDGTAQQLNALGGDQYLTDLWTGVVTISGVAHHARRLVQLAEARRWVETATAIRAAGLTAGDPEAFVAESERALMALTASRAGDGDTVSFKRVIGETVRELEQRFKNSGKRGAITGIPSGLDALDSLTLGWQPSELAIIAARPGMGKSSLMMDCILAAAKKGVACLAFSLEMSRKALGERSISSDAGVDGTAMKTGLMQSSDWLRIVNAATRIVDLPICINDRAGQTVSEIRSAARRWAMREAAQAERRLVVVDYLQIAQGGKAENRTREIAEMTRDLKELAKELSAPVIVLSQLNRDVEKRADKRPLVSDLRDGGSIEQDADVIAFIYRDDYYHADTDDKGIAEIIVAKNRNGATGTARVGWRAELTKFVNLANQQEYGK